MANDVMMCSLIMVSHSICSLLSGFSARALCSNVHFWKFLRTVLANGVMTLSMPTTRRIKLTNAVSSLSGCSLTLSKRA